MKESVNKDEMDEVRVELIMRTQGSGYLKVPKKIKEMVQEDFEKHFVELPSPKLFFEVKDGKLKMLYEFDLEGKYDGEVDNKYVSG